MVDSRELLPNSVLPVHVHADMEVDISDRHCGIWDRNTSSDAAGKVSGAAVLVYARHALLFPGWQRDVAHLSPDIFHLAGTTLADPTHA